MSGSDKTTEIFTPDRAIHEPARLQIVSYLAASGRPAAFTELKEKLNLTAGNLSVQLKRLEEAGYIAIAKSIRDRKPLTRVTLTRPGMAALQQYLEQLEEMIGRVKRSAAPQGPEEGKNSGPG